MSEIITLPHRHYIGTAAEIAGITGVCGDTAYETDTDIYKHWNGAAWVTGGEPYWVERLTGAVDKTAADLTEDGNWHVDGLDLSAIIPPGAIMAKIKITVADDAANSYVSLRRDAVNDEHIITSRTHVANIPDTRVEDISLESNRLLDYRCAAVVFTSIAITVLGWWMRRCL